MKAKRPLNVNVFHYRFPLPAIVSILHRVSGVLLFLFIPFLLYALQLSLSSAAGFDEVTIYLNQPVIKFVVWACMSAFVYHLFAGIRHLFMDSGYGESLVGGRFTSVLVMLFSLIFIVLAGVWLW